MNRSVVNFYREAGLSLQNKIASIRALPSLTVAGGSGIASCPLNVKIVTNRNHEGVRNEVVLDRGVNLKEMTSPDTRTLLGTHLNLPLNTIII